ncbi:OLC1v1033497C1 [Oldenlandia corymbosa var. corymbosa]|uniref:OLC1v1033497C1 n=1 Tax=Oldenlandia corymbosa var. corymbosa TaxID=529605 RepID=A0AAV1CP64_OLDCO|nr:OLC1v1033497C1 [Oldenlandia corymbosa var. corymbosa]
MAYRRRQGITRASTFKEDSIYSSSSSSPPPTSAPPSSSSLAAQAIRASAAHRDSSLSSAYASPDSFSNDRSKGPTYDYTSMRSSNEAGGFWGVLARKAKSILDENDTVVPHQLHSNSRENSEFVTFTNDGQFQYSSFHPVESSRKIDNPRIRKGLDALTSSMNRIGDTIGNALEEGRTIVESKTADIIQETRRLQIRRRGVNFEEQNNQESAVQPQQMVASPEEQIKASRDVAMATAAKAKLLLRELKTVKADLAFAKQRCSQLEDENKILREARDTGDNPADDDMIRLQLETLLAEKARLAHENSVYSRENRFLREIVEYHQLTMQDVVYLDEGIEEVTEVYPIPAVSRMLSASPPSSQNSSPGTSPYRTTSSPIPRLSLDGGPHFHSTASVEVPQSADEAPTSGSSSPESTPEAASSTRH